MASTWIENIEKIIKQQIETKQIFMRQEGLKRPPFMIAIVGIPGSGKTTVANRLIQSLNQIENNNSCLIMPFDGYHYPKEKLKNFPNPEDAIYRRGAPDTFELEKLLIDLDSIRNGNESIIKLPGFEHAKGDPEPDFHTFNRDLHRIVICEGLYLLHNQDGWDRVKSYFDYCIFIQADIDNCMERLKSRNQCIPGYSIEEIMLRVDKVDRINAKIVEKSKERADVVITT